MASREKWTECNDTGATNVDSFVFCRDNSPIKAEK